MCLSPAHRVHIDPNESQLHPHREFERSQIPKFDLGTGQELELSFQEFRGNFEKVISRFRIETMKEMMKSRNVLEKVSTEKLMNKELEHINTVKYMQNKVTFCLLISQLLTQLYY